MRETCLIIGAGQAGLTAAQSLREAGFAGGIILAGAESHAPYQRPPLSKKVLSGEMAPERLALKPAAFFEAQAIDWRGDITIRDIDMKAGRAVHDAGTIPFDHLIFTTGTTARQLPLRDMPASGIFTLRGIDDAARLKAHLTPGCRVVIIGAGYIGLEVAASATLLGAQVTVIEAAPRVLMRSLGPQLSRYFEELHGARGVRIETGTLIAHIEQTASGLVAFAADGRSFAADLVLVAVGSQPVTELATKAGVAVDDGITVDEACRASDGKVLAAGDCTRFFSRRYRKSLRLESVQNAIDQAKAAALTLVGRPTRYDPLPWFWSDQFNIKLQIAGLSNSDQRVVVRGDVAAHSFSAFYFASARLMAVDSINRPRDHMLARRVIGREIIGEPEQLTHPDVEAWEKLFEG